MNAIFPDSGEIVSRLSRALRGASLPAREAENCQRLLEKLTRPVRVGVFGLSTGGDDWLLAGLLGPGILPQGPDWPTLEVVYGPRLITHVTTEFGDAFEVEGPATADTLARQPIFLRIEAPNPMLRRMSFLYVATDDAPDELLSALDWAEPRTEISIWTTDAFTDVEANIWALAPDGLKNHALMVLTGPAQDEALLIQRANHDFESVYHVPRQAADPIAVQNLLMRLDSDINEAQLADIDAAQLFLHRLGHLLPAVPRSRHIRPQGDAGSDQGHAAFALDHPVTPLPSAAPLSLEPSSRILDVPAPAPAGPAMSPAGHEAATAPHPYAPAATPAPELAPEPAPEPAPEAVDPAAASQPDPAPVTAPDPGPSEETVAMLSEPFLYLKRRSRALLEIIEWHIAEAGDEDSDAGEWAAEVLEHCCETTEGLQSRASDWPEDDACALTLRRTLDEACDVAILLQVEGGSDQAQDAAAMLLQLRGDFERKLAA